MRRGQSCPHSIQLNVIARVPGSSAPWREWQASVRDLGLANQDPRRVPLLCARRLCVRGWRRLADSGLHAACLSLPGPRYSVLGFWPLAAREAVHVGWRRRLPHCDELWCVLTHRLSVLCASSSTTRAPPHAGSRGTCRFTSSITSPTRLKSYGKDVKNTVRHRVNNAMYVLRYVL